MSTHAITAAPAAANLTANVATAQVFALATNPTQACVLSVPGTKRLEAKKFVVRASGSCTSVGATTTFSPFLAVGNSLAIGSDTILCQATGVTVNATSCPWEIEATLYFDSISGKLNGTFNSLVNGTVGASASITGTITGLNGNSEPVFQLVAGGQFSAGAVGNIVTLSEFVLDN